MTEAVVVVIPCYNEAARLDAAAFADATASANDLRLVFVDDGSTDETRRMLTILADEIGSAAKVLPLPENLGKAEAVRRGMLLALDTAATTWRPRAVGYWDADLATPLEDAVRFAEVLDDRLATLAVIGSRVRLMGRHIDRRALRHYSGRVFATLASLALGFPVYDTQCGAKLFRAGEDIRRVLERPFETGWAFDVEILARIAAIRGRDVGAHGTVIELPLDRWRDIPGSKVRLRDLPGMAGDLLKIYRRYR